MRRALLILIILGTSLACSGFAAPLLADDFRVDTHYFIGNDKKPSADVLTIFQGGIAYDFQGVETMILDSRRGKLTLLNSKHQARATLDTAELLDAAISLQTEALQSKIPALVAAARPDFQKSTEDFVQNGGAFTKLTFKNASLQYTVEAQAARFPTAAQEYKYVVDWSARLNSLRPTGMPAGARLEVNEALAAKGLIPTRIERSMPGAKTARTQHSVIWKLSQEDHRRIDETGTQLVNYRLMSFDEYVNLK